MSTVPTVSASVHPYPWLHITSLQFNNMDACRLARQWLIEQRFRSNVDDSLNLEAAWLALNHRPDWMIWLLQNVPDELRTLTRHQVEQLSLMFAQHFLYHFTVVASEYRYAHIQEGTAPGPMLTLPPPKPRQVLASIDAAIGMMACNSPDATRYQELIDFFSCVIGGTNQRDNTGEELNSAAHLRHKNGQRAIRTLRHALRIHRKFAENTSLNPSMVLHELMDAYMNGLYIASDTDADEHENQWYCDTIRYVVTPELVRQQQPIASTVSQHDEESE